MHPDDPNRMWLCCNCGRGFTFNSDVEDHRHNFKHSKMMLCDLQNGRKKKPQMFTHGLISLDFHRGGNTSRFTVEYEYYPSTRLINYVDVRYADNKLKCIVEGNSEMMMKVDTYLRSILNQKLSAGS